MPICSTAFVKKRFKLKKCATGIKLLLSISQNSVRTVIKQIDNFENRKNKNKRS